MNFVLFSFLFLLPSLLSLFLFFFETRSHVLPEYPFIYKAQAKLELLIFLSLTLRC